MLRRTGSIADARYAFTDRYGGASTAPYAELNLGDHVGDDPAAVATTAAGWPPRSSLDPARLVLMRQVHGRDGRRRRTARRTRRRRCRRPTRWSPPAAASASWCWWPTASRCCWRPGAATSWRWRTPVGAGSRPGSCRPPWPRCRSSAPGRAGSSPSSARPSAAAATRCPASSPTRSTAVVPAAAATSATGTPALDLRAGVVAQLLAAGVETIEADPWCTAESPDLFSYRRDGVTGRFAGVVVT